MADQTPAPKPSSDPRFVYRDIGPSSLSVGQWDKIGASVFDGTAGPLGLIKALVMATFASLYVGVRAKLISMQQELEKQKYEQGQAAGNQSSVDGDDLGSQRRKLQ